jgi:molybdopterin-guanine dinucleotide biosynthesis protein A
MSPAATPVLGLLLAGGLARRMGGGDKSLREIGGRSLLAHVIERAQPQVERLVLNANGDLERFGGFGLPVIPDAVPGHAGPLAGVLAGLEWAARVVPAATHVMSLATDTPFFPHDLAARLQQALAAERAEIACAASGGRSHPVIALWPVSLAPALRTALVEEDLRKIDRFTARYRTVAVAFEDEAGDPFFNLNTPDDLALAEARLRAGAG